jgi:hypothetical protein
VRYYNLADPLMQASKLEGSLQVAVEGAVCDVPVAFAESLLGCLRVRSPAP